MFLQGNLLLLLVQQLERNFTIPMITISTIWWHPYWNHPGLDVHVCVCVCVWVCEWVSVYVFAEYRWPYGTVGTVGTLCRGLQCRPWGCVSSTTGAYTSARLVIYGPVMASLWLETPAAFFGLFSPYFLFLISILSLTRALSLSLSLSFLFLFLFFHLLFLLFLFLFSLEFFGFFSLLCFFPLCILCLSIRPPSFVNDWINR